MDPNTFVYLVITFMAIIVVLSTIKTVILHFILDNVEEIVYHLKVMDICKKANDLGKKRRKGECMSEEK